MNNVSSVILRNAGSCLRPKSWLSPLQILAGIRCASTASSHRLNTGSLIRCQRQDPPALKPIISVPCSLRRSFSASSILKALRISKDKGEQGLSFRKKPLSIAELRDVFGNGIPPGPFANRLLRVLHGRRVDGTLDLALPPDMQATLERYPTATDQALYWLRSNYDVDEDAAIIARIEREESGVEQDSPSELMERGQRLGLYGPQRSTKQEENVYTGPQSGQYQARLSEKEGDVFGQSELEKIRVENEAKAAQEEEDLQKQITEITDRETKKLEQEQKAQDMELASRPEQGIEAASKEIRPPNEFEKWILRSKNRATSKLTLEDAKIANRSKLSFIWPSTIFVAVLLAGLYLYKESWEPPKRTERIWPNMSLSFATVAGITSINFAVFLMWRFPPAWSLLNRFFLVVPATIRPLSLLGSVFSHSSWRHLAFNSIPLVVFGPSLHEELGRADFVCLYLASGVLGSYVSLLHNVFRGVLITSSLGASGAIWGVTAAFLNLHSEDKFTVFFIPDQWKDTFYAKGWMFLIALIGFDVISMFRAKIQTINYFAHFGGAASGWAYAELWKRREAEARNMTEFKARPTRAWWQHLTTGGGSQEDRGR